jgi:LasA protease
MPRSTFRPWICGFLFLWVFLMVACNFPLLAARTQTPLDDGSQIVAPAQFTTNQPTPLLFPNPTSGFDPTYLNGLHSATPGTPHPAPNPTLEEEEISKVSLYMAQSGDTLATISQRFGITPDQISSSGDIPSEGFIQPGQILSVPDQVGYTPYPSALLPDSEVINSPSTIDFDLRSYIDQAGGFLSTFGETVDEDYLTAAEIIQRVAMDTSINPRLLLAFLEYRSHWLFGQPTNLQNIEHPIGFYVPGHQGLYEEILLSAKQIGIGYYGWRSGGLTVLTFPDESEARLSLELNAGSVALQYLFSKFYRQSLFLDALYGSDGFIEQYERMFGDPWVRASAVEPLLSPGVAQPELELPFPIGERWSFTGGPHKAWDSGSPIGALDFSPVSGGTPCSDTKAWVTASASGLVTRSERNIVALDLDGDGFEQTGWVLIYFHIADKDRVVPGTHLSKDDPLGHPSCQGGNATGTNVHFARKYQGEWMAADGPVPFVLSGWRVKAGTRSYEGVLFKSDRSVEANSGGSSSSIIIRESP